MLLVLLLLVYVPNVAYPHGSSHPKWKIHYDYYNKPYLECSNTIISTEQTIFKIRNCGFCDGTLHEYNVESVTDYDTLRKLSLLIDGKRCKDIDNYDFSRVVPTQPIVIDSQESLANKILNETSIK